MQKGPRGDDRAPLIDHPQPIGDLAEIFLRRRIAVGADSNGNVVLVRPDSIVVDPQGDPARVEEITRLVEQRDREDGRQMRRHVEIEGTDLLRVPVAAARKRTTIEQEERWTLEEAVAEVERFRADSYRCQLNHVVLGAQVFTGDPLGAHATWVGDMAFPSTTTTSTSSGSAALLSTATPVPPPSFLRPRLNLHENRPRVLVLDTGLRTVDGAGVAVEHPELADCKLHQPWLRDPAVGARDDEDEADDDTTGVLDFEAGHGTFVAGVVRQLCPDADIQVAGVLSSFGDGDISSVISGIRRALGSATVAGGEAPQRPDVVVMSFGGFFENDDPGVFADKLHELLGDAVVVAAAGNQHTCRPYFPAALPSVIGVGGLAPDGRAWFSNYGGWVDACAPAIDVVSTFFTDFTEVIDGVATRRYDGWARWSGTSFSAPKVAAAISQEQYLHGGSAQDAWRRLRSHKLLRYPDLGLVFNL